MTHQCTRSHPHENMDEMCELRTEIARLTNELAQIKQDNRELDVICQDLQEMTYTQAMRIAELEAKLAEKPCVPHGEPKAWKHFEEAYQKACFSSRPQDWIDAALLALQVRNTYPYIRQPKDKNG